MDTIKSSITDIFCSLRYFFKRLIRVIQYLPIIWKNEDWDHSYIFDLLSYKLGRVEKCLKNDPYHQNAKRYARQVQVCRILLERLIADNYCEYEKKKHDEKWGELKHKDGKRYKAGVELIFYRDKCQTEEEKTLETEESKRIWKKEEELRKRDLESFCRIFNKHCESWWT